MKLSEAIIELTKAIEVHGDIALYNWDSYGQKWESVSLNAEEDDRGIHLLFEN